MQMSEMKHTNENRRSSKRRLTPYLAVEIDGQVFQIKDWSMSGFAIYELDRFGPGLRIGSDIEGRFGRSDDGAPTYPFSATVADVRERENVAAFEFTELFAESFTALECLLLTMQVPGAEEAAQSGADQRIYG